MSDERKVQEVLARYVRATDRRDGKRQGALFTDDAVVRIQVKAGPDHYEPFGEPLIGGAGVEYAVTNLMPAHPEGGSSHHTTMDHIVDVDGDRAHLNAQFIVYRVRASTIEPVESGYYDTDLRRLDGEWKIVKHTVLLDMSPAR
jgi:ketosteroid isomerase-like protein